MSKKKYYVVWEGKKTGVFDSWTTCKNSVDGYRGAKYKSFTDKKLATKAFQGAYEDFKQVNTSKKQLTAKERMPVENQSSIVLLWMLPVVETQV